MSLKPTDYKYRARAYATVILLEVFVGLGAMAVACVRAAGSAVRRKRATSVKSAYVLDVRGKMKNSRGKVFKTRDNTRLKKIEWQENSTPRNVAEQQLQLRKVAPLRCGVS